MRSLSDVMSASDLSLYPIIGLVLFMTAFTLIIYYAFAKRNRETFERAAQIPLTDDVVTPRNAASDRASDAPNSNDDQTDGVCK
jgi:cbb3-type cytochrome oxidase subunit 3